MVNLAPAPLGTASTPRPGLTTSPTCACSVRARPQRWKGRPTGRSIAITADEDLASITPSDVGTGMVVRFLYTRAVLSFGWIWNGRPKATLDEAGAQREDAIQRAVFEHLAAHGVHVVFAFHPANSGYRRPIERARPEGTLKSATASTTRSPYSKAGACCAAALGSGIIAA